MARRSAWMAAYAQLFATSLFAGLFAFTGTVTLLSTLMGATSETLATYFAAAYFAKPARLILERILAAQTWLGSQGWTFRTILVVWVARVRNLRMATLLSSFALETAWRRLRATRQRRLQHSAATIATDLVEDGFSASSTSALVAKFLAAMVRVPALELAAATTCADVFSLKTIISLLRRGVQRTRFASRGFPLSSFPFAGAAVFSTLMPAAIEGNTAHAHALRRFFGSLVADGGKVISTTSTRD